MTEQERTKVFGMGLLHIFFGAACMWGYAYLQHVESWAARPAGVTGVGFFLIGLLSCFVAVNAK